MAIEDNHMTSVEGRKVFIYKRMAGVGPLIKKLPSLDPMLIESIEIETAIEFLIFFWKASNMLVNVLTSSLMIVTARMSMKTKKPKVVLMVSMLLMVSMMNQMKMKAAIEK